MKAFTTSNYLKNFVIKFTGLAIFLSVHVWIASSALAQAPHKMSYQGVIRNSNDALITNSNIGIQISILQGSIQGSAVFVETHTTTSNAQGLVSLQIGDGNAVAGDFSAINWANGPYFIQTETDPNGGTDYTISGTTQFMSVPYALYAETAGTPGPQGDAGKSAYEIAVQNGFEGSEATWLDSLKGEKGQDGHAPNGTNPGEMLYWNGTNWVQIPPGQENEVLTFRDGKPIWAALTHIRQYGDTITHLGLTYIEVINHTTGRTWLDRNLGATRAATSKTDEESYGDYFQWGRAADGHEKANSQTTHTLSSSDTPGHGKFITVEIPQDFPFDWRHPQKDGLWQKENPVNNPCPTGYRVPTQAEWDIEKQSWNSMDADGAFGSVLQLPMAGLRNHSEGQQTDGGVAGNYWTSTTQSPNSYYVKISSTTFYTVAHIRASGLPVRCIKDE